MSKNWAIAIGINDYYNLQPLQYAVQDAASIRDFFLQDGGFEQVYYFAEGAPPIETPRGPMRSQPTYANLKRFLRERFQRQFLDVGDNFWFFFAGHGELHEGHDYLMPLDVDPGNLEETALRISDITAYLRNCGADNTVLLLDACRSQGQRKGLGLGTEEQQGMITVYSCSPREASYEIDALGHGAFTHALLEGFKLQGATNCATVERLDQYLRYQVPLLNEQHGKPVQTPYTAVEPLSKNCLILLPRQATLQDVQALKIAAQQAEFITEDLDLAQQLWVRVLAASTIDQDAIAAIGRIALKKAGQTTSPGPQGTETAGSRSVEGSPLPPTQTPPPVQPNYRTERVAPPPPPKPAAPSFSFEVVTVNGQGQITQRDQRSTEYRREDLGSGVTLDLVKLPGGTFTMGSSSNEEKRDDDEGPQHEVTVPQFWMGKYPVTQAQYEAVMGKNPSRFSKNGANRPVERVNWDQATEFCQKLSQQTGRAYRLPSEAEWEYACRAGTTTPFHFGPTITTDLANYNGTFTYGSGPKGQYREQTTEVGGFPANAFGLYDMHGNVWEWCLDHWHDSYDGAPTDGSAWTEGSDSSRRVLRGGSWFSIPGSCRSAARFWVARVNEIDGLGFRIVCASSWTLG
jgi:formylglycine-generating enzyme required for sulfatase activity